MTQSLTEAGARTEGPPRGGERAGDRQGGPWGGHNVLTVPAWHTCPQARPALPAAASPRPPRGSLTLSRTWVRKRGRSLSARSRSQAPGPPLTAHPAGGGVTSLFPAQIAAAAKSQYNKNVFYWLKNVDTGLRMLLPDTSTPLAFGEEVAWPQVTRAVGLCPRKLQRVLGASGCCVLPLDPCPPRSLRRAGI